jgi:hypothetical protein
MRARWTTAVVIGMLLAAPLVFPQESVTENVPEKVPEKPSEKPAEKAPAGKTPKEYEKEEFPPFLRALRRGEIILFGTFPISLFLTFEVYDLGRYFAYGQQLAYAPWPFRPPNAEAYSSEDNRNVLLIAASVSLALAITDYVIGRVIAKRAARRSGPNR